MYGARDDDALDQLNDDNYDQRREIYSAEDHRQMLAETFEGRLRDRVDEADDRVVRIGLDPRHQRRNDYDIQVERQQTVEGLRDENNQVGPGVHAKALSLVDSAAKLARAIAGGMHCSGHDIRKTMLGESAQRGLGGATGRSDRADQVGDVAL